MRVLCVCYSILHVLGNKLFVVLYGLRFNWKTKLRKNTILVVVGDKGVVINIEKF